MLVAGTFVWALYLSEQWINQHWNQKEWNDRFIARVNDLFADFTDRIALRPPEEGRLRARQWHGSRTRWSSRSKTRRSGRSSPTISSTTRAYPPLYVLFLVAPPRTPARLRRKSSVASTPR